MGSAESGGRETHLGERALKRENDLGRDPVRSLVLRVALPSMLAQFVSVFYSIVDRMYIGNIPEIGDTALAGVGICGPIVTLIGAFAFLVGVGGAPLMSIRLGEGDREAAERILANCFLMLLLLSAVLTAASLLLREKLLMWFGASPVTFPYANAYITIYLMGTVFALLSSGLNQFIVCQGFANAAMRSVLLGAVLNIALDPVFIFLLDMGVRGAALATVLSQMASCAYVVLLFLFGRRPPVRITFGGYRFKTVRSVLTVGLTSFLIIAMDNVMIIAMNTLLQRYGGAGEGDMLVTCATIMQSFMLMVTMPLGGITGGTQSILGFTGVYFPFTGEANVNVDAPACLVPATIAHEMAHQRGIASEQECNFLAVLTCEMSGNAVYEYSGWLMGFIHLSNALYSVDPEGWAQLHGQLNDEVQADLRDNNAYWAQFESPAANVSQDAYDQFLKSYGESSGIQSYGEVVDLLVVYYGGASEE